MKVESGGSPERSTPGVAMLGNGRRTDQIRAQRWHHPCGQGAERGYVCGTYRAAVSAAARAARSLRTRGSL
eukprot:5148963-Pleurochrysis_carterae.AAC.1